MPGAGHRGRRLRASRICAQSCAAPLLISFSMNTMQLPSIFHFAFNVTDLEAARGFYGEVNKLPGRAQHRYPGGLRFLRPPDLAAPGARRFATARNEGKVGQHTGACRTSGIILLLPQWQARWRSACSKRAPTSCWSLRCASGEPGEQWACCFRDRPGDADRGQDFALRRSTPPEPALRARRAAPRGGRG